MSEMRLSFLIQCEAAAWEKIKGKRPTCLIVSNDSAEIIWKESYNFIVENEDMKFENPINQLRQYMGMNIVVAKWVYGGTFQWALGE